MIMKKTKKGGPSRTWAGLLLYLVVFIVLIYFFSWMGLLGFLLFLVLTSCRRVWRSREYIREIMKTIECTIFGKPLDKEMWKDGELKNTKVKFVWGKKKGQRDDDGS